MPTRRDYWFEINGQQYEHASFTQGMGHEPPGTKWFSPGGTKRPQVNRPAIEPNRDDWSVEVPLVLWMLDQVSAGAATVDQVRDELVQATDLEQFPIDE